MHCLNRARLTLVLALLGALVGCGDSDDADDAVLPVPSLESTPSGEPHGRRFVPTAGAVYEAQVQHEVSVELETEAEAPAGGGTETWHVRATVADPTKASVELVVDGKKTRGTWYYAGHLPPVGTSNEPLSPRGWAGDLAGMAGMSSWLPEQPVRVGQTWTVPHLIPAEYDPRWKDPDRAQTARARLESVDADGTWHVRLAVRDRVSGMAEDEDVRAHVLVVQRIEGTAQIDTEGQPRRFELTYERVEEANGTRVRTSRRRIRGTARRVK